MHENVVSGTLEERGIPRVAMQNEIVHRDDHWQGAEERRVEVREKCKIGTRGAENARKFRLFRKRVVGDIGDDQSMGECDTPNARCIPCDNHILHTRVVSLKQSSNKFPRIASKTRSRGRKPAINCNGRHSGMIAVCGSPKY